MYAKVDFQHTYGSLSCSCRGQIERYILEFVKYLAWMIKLSLLDRMVSKTVLSACFLLKVSSHIFVVKILISKFHSRCARTRWWKT